MYCLEKNFTFNSYRQRIESWLSCYYFDKLYMKKTAAKLGDIAVYYAECDEFWSDSWSLNVDSKQGLDFLYFVNKYFKEPKEEPKSYYERTQILIEFLCLKSHTRMIDYFTPYTYMTLNDTVYNAISQLHFRTTRLFKYFTNRASKDNLIWLTYALFLYEVFFRLNKREKLTYSENPLDFYKYAEGSLYVLS